MIFYLAFLSSSLSLLVFLFQTPPKILISPASLSYSCNFIFFPPCFCRPAALNGEEASLKTCSGGWDCNGTHNAAVILELQLVMGSVSIPWCTGTSWEGEGWRERGEAWAGSLLFPSLPLFADYITTISHFNRRPDLKISLHLKQIAFYFFL